MDFSFLYKEKSDSCEIHGCIKELSIDRIVALIASDLQTQRYVINILSKLERNKANIVWRQEIIADFINSPLLYGRLSELFNNFHKIMEDWQGLRKDIYNMKAVSKESAMTGDVRESLLLILKINSEILLRIFKFYISLGTFLSENNIQSELLIKLRDFCKNIMDNPAFRELGDIIAELTVLRLGDTSYEIICEFNHRLRIIDSRLYKIGHYNNTEPKRKGLFSIFKSEKAKTLNTVSVEMNFKTVQEMNSLLFSSISKTADVIEGIIKAFSEPFEDKNEELVFYKFALLYCEQFKGFDMNLCTPAIKDMREDCFKCEKLYDLYIAQDNARKSGKLTKAVVPNDALLINDKAGILIRGRNNTGKTVFLRSIGVAQVFAQAGLPVPAQSAEISIRSIILTQFSSKEEDLSVEGIAGRFEGEVKAVSEIINNLSEGALVLLNETFQTTAFDEAKTALFDILCVFTKLSVKWVFVTHIHGLFHMLSDFEKESGGKRVVALSTFDEEDEINRYRLRIL